MTPPARPPAEGGGGPARHPYWRAAVVALVTLGLLWWALRGVALADVGRHLAGVRVGYLLAAVLVATSLFPLRLFRWRLLLRGPEGGTLPFRPLWHAVAMGFMANNIMPFRAGELVRAYSAGRLAGVRVTTAFSSIAVERVFDGLAMVFLLTLSLLAPGLPADVRVAGVPVARLAALAALLCAAALVAAGLVVAFPVAAEGLIRRLVPWPALAGRLVGLVEGVRAGLGVLRAPGRLAGVIAWSVVLWVINAGSFYLAFRAFDLPVGFTGALLLQGVLTLGISVPVPTPGFLGWFEVVIQAALALYAVAPDVALSYAIAYHVTTFLPITLLGLWSLWRTHLGLRVLREAPADG